MAKYPTFEGARYQNQVKHDIYLLTNRTEVMGCQTACFEWADSYDSKDWKRLEKCIAPTLRVGHTLHYLDRQHVLTCRLD